MPRKVLAKKSIFDVNFENPFELSGKPIQDSRLPDFNVNGNWKNNVFNVNSIGFAMFGGSVTYDGGKKTANINKKTLEKSGATLLGMAPQVNQRNQITQGFNYANPNYTNAVANNKNIQSIKSKLGIGSVMVDKRTQFENNKKKVDAILQARIGTTVAPDMEGGEVDQQLNDPYYQTPEQEVVQGQINARLKQASRNKVERAFASINTDPSIIRANQIQSELGRAQIGIVVTRRRRGRWSTALSGDPAKVIDDYNKKTAVINWAKEVDPQHAKIGEDKKNEVVKSTSKRVPIMWTHNNNTRVVGYRTVYNNEWDMVPVKSLIKGKQMDYLYGKIMEKAEGKKKRYESFYNTNPEIGNYNYYGITDEEFGHMDEYKTSLVSNIRKTSGAKYQIKESLATSFDLDASTALDDDAPKQNYLQYQITGKDDFITPTVRGLQSEISTIDSDVKSQEAKITKHQDVIQSNLQSLDSDQMIASLQKQIDADKKTSDYQGSFQCRPARLCASHHQLKKIADDRIELNEAKILSIKDAELDNTIENLDKFKSYSWSSPQATNIQKAKLGMDEASNKIATIRADVGGYRGNENQNLKNAITFVEGKSREFVVNGDIIANRDNLGRVTISDKATYEKYIKNTPSQYLKQPDKLDSTVIPELEKENEEEISKYSDIEKEYYRKERAKAQFAGSTKPKARVRTTSRRRRR